jgi:hypothetical protein
MRKLISETNVCHPIDQAQRSEWRAAVSKNDLSADVRLAHPFSVVDLVELQQALG